MPDQTGKIRVLVVDDSAFMRVALRKMMETDPEIQVIEAARNGEEALAKIKELRPDVVTMDVEMPVMDGLTALGRVMAETPTPVIMISALTEEGADATFKALELGAVDFIPKGGKSYVNLDIVKVSEQLRQKIRAIVSRNRTRRILPAPIPPKPVSPVVRFNTAPQTRPCQLVALGTSTGGPMALTQLLPQIPKEFSKSILMVQHMPPMFTGPFAKRLNSLSQISVKEAENGEIVEPGRAYLAPGGIHMKVQRERMNQLRIVLDPEPSEKLFIPSVDVMMLSVAEAFQGNILGVIMTGMGSDGFKGMTAIKNKRGVTVAQDEESCVVYGMPRVCVEAGIVDHVLPLDQLARSITQLTGHNAPN
jgi:two-component system chemotaxis response regulator CheB